MSTLPPPVYFGGLDLGLTGEFRRGPWTLEWLAKVAVGPSRGAVDVSGATTATVPGFAPQTSAGGLLALSSNSGHFDRNRVAVVPELGVKLGYQVTPRLRALVGYDFLYWTDVVRPGSQIDMTINSNLLPPALAARRAESSLRLCLPPPTFGYKGLTSDWNSGIKRSHVPTRLLRARWPADTAGRAA